MAGHCRWAAAPEVDPRWPERCPPRQLLSDAPNAGRRRRRPTFGAATTVFAPRRSRTPWVIVEIGDASSVFLPFVAMAFHSDQRSRLVNRLRDPLLAVRPRTQTGCMPGSSDRPVAIR